MYFLMSYCIVVIFYIQMVSSQVELKRVSPPPFDCGSSLKLICKYSGLAACCSADTRVWRRNNTQIMNNGVESSTTGKYTELIDVTQKSFELTITNIGASDFGINYVCAYGFDASTPLKLKDTHLRCGKCPKCGGRCFGWGCLATLWANYSMMVGIFILIWRDHEDGEDETTNSKDSCCKRFLHDGYFIALISTLLSAAIAIPIGLYYCICYDFGDDAYLYYPDPSFISVGYIVVISTLLMMKCFKCKDLNCKDVCILIGIIITCPFGPILYSAYIFKYVKMKTWKDVGFKDILLVLSGVITYGIAVFLLCKDWPIEEKNNPEKKTQGGKSQSVESGSSCWPICRVGQDPNTSSSGPEKVRRSPEKERADKKKERKPTEVVRPQPSRPLPSRAQHLKTDNTGREEYSAENELFKPRPLPSISGHSDSPRPLPKRTPDDQLEKGGIQLEPLVDSTSEKKKKKKRKKKETKQSDEDD